MKLLSKFITFLIFVTCILALLVAFFGVTELFWWIATGDFFHFVTTTVSNSTF